MKKQGGKLKWVIRINRNIVECKSCLTPVRLEQIPELIETLWNVNFNKSIILSDGFMN